jgi:hypothetical protein
MVAPATAGVRRTPRRGTSSACAPNAYALVAKASLSRSRTRPSLGSPTRVRRSPLTPKANTGGGGAFIIGIAAGQTHASGRNRHRGWGGRTQRGSPRVFRSRKGGCRTRSKRKKVTAFVPARIASSGWCPHVVHVVAEVGRRRQVSNKLTRQRSKKGGGASEQGPSAETSSAVTRRGSLRAKRRFASRTAPVLRCRIGEGPGWRESVIRRLFRSPKASRQSRDWGRNDHRIVRRVPDRRKASRVSRSIVIHAAMRTVALAASQSSKEREGASTVRINREEATGMSEARSLRAPREDNTRAHFARPYGRQSGNSRKLRSAESGGSVVKRPYPRSSRAEPRIPRGIHVVKATVANAGNTRGAGTRRSFGWQKSIGRIARLGRWEVARPRGDHRALAGRKPEASLTRRTGGEKAKRCAEGLSSDPSLLGPKACRFRLAGSRDDGRRSWATARLAFTGKTSKGS